MLASNSSSSGYVNSLYMYPHSYHDVPAHRNEYFAPRETLCHVPILDEFVFFRTPPLEAASSSEAPFLVPYIIPENQRLNCSLIIPPLPCFDILYSLILCCSPHSSSLSWSLFSHSRLLPPAHRLHPPPLPRRHRLPPSRSTPTATRQSVSTSGPQTMPTGHQFRCESQSQLYCKGHLQFA